MLSKFRMMLAKIILIFFALLFFLTSRGVQANLLSKRSHISLDPKGFEVGIDKGIVLVVFYVPDCVQCTRLYTLLTELKLTVEEESISYKNITIGAINCTKYQEFCTEKNITTYPSLFLFEKNDKYRELSIYIDLIALLKLLGLPKTKTCRSGEVFKLEPHNFNSTISQGKYFIKFYKPSCPQCVLLAPIWKDLAKEMKNETNLCVTEYNCETNILVCRDLNIRSVPQILWFQDGINVRQYEGGRNMTALKRFTEEMIRSDGSFRSGTLSTIVVNKIYTLTVSIIMIKFYISVM